ncbi:7228_t:CDS:2 [Funneliformis mosseae]|uniref:7228_t:CDS:1 n=1 Tax=Funneliformis mosseae TaxID=27381 RepID=A0A9N9B3T0_FUNMO|nr:7228_t:CDS:2 [Funneliformis mosseae]
MSKTSKTSKKRKESESEGSSTPTRRSKRIASQDSFLAEATRLSPTSSDNLIKIPNSASNFKINDIKLLRVRFEPASNKNDVFLHVKVESISHPEAQTFATKLHNVVLNGFQVLGTDESSTDTLLDDLLRIVKLNNFPLMIRNHPPCKLHIEEEPYVSSIPEFVIKNKRSTIIGVEDNHLRNTGLRTGYGESQIAVEILASYNENVSYIRALRLENRRNPGYTDQISWAVRVITTYVTFYKVMIPTTYWQELENGLPKESSVVIQRWPAENSLSSGLDLSDPTDKNEVLDALVKIREEILNENEL